MGPDTSIVLNMQVYSKSSFTDRYTAADTLFSKLTNLRACRVCRLVALLYLLLLSFDVIAICFI